MNERIKKHALEAFGSTIDNDPILVYEAEKFAELIVGRGTDPSINNHATIASDKSVLDGLDRNRPAGGYPAAQEKAIAEMRQRVADYEVLHREVK
jgi:hypothetical protein